MARQLKGSICFLLIESRRNLLIFWSILLSLLILSLLINLIIFKEGVVIFELSFPIYVFLAIIGQMTVKNSIPYLVKMGSTRLNIFKSVGVYFFLLSLFNAVFANTIHSIIIGLFGQSNNSPSTFLTVTGFTEETIAFNHIADFFQNIWWSRVLIDTSILFFLLVVSFVIGLIFYKFGVIGGISFLAVAMITLITGISTGWLIEIMINLFTNISLLFFIELFLAALIIYLLSFLLLRRLSIA